jgi:hypothetical protein
MPVVGYGRQHGVGSRPKLEGLFMITEIPPRYWGPNIVISGNAFLLSGQSEAQRAFAVQRANLYQVEVQQVLRTIEIGSKTKTGELLLTAISKTLGGKTLRIVPLKGDAQDARAFAGNVGRATAAGEEYNDAGLRAVLKGKGGGCDVVIAFDPRTFISPDSFRSALPTRQYLQDDVLFHELVHGLRMMRGLLLNHNILAAPGRVGFSSPEEFYAILLTDIYISECGRGLEAIRVDHAPAFHSIEGSPEFADKSPQSYYAAYREAIEKLADQMDDFTRPIGDLRTINWNPLRYHYHPIVSGASTSMDQFDGLSGTGSTKPQGEFIFRKSEIFPPGWTPKN